MKNMPTIIRERDDMTTVRTPITNERADVAANFEALCAMSPKQPTPWARVRQAYAAHMSTFGADDGGCSLRYRDEVQRQYPIVHCDDHAITVVVDGYRKAVGWDALFVAACHNDDRQLCRIYRALLLMALRRWEHHGRDYIRRDAA